MRSVNVKKFPNNTSAICLAFGIVAVIGIVLHWIAHVQPAISLDNEEIQNSFQFIKFQRKNTGLKSHIKVFRKGNRILDESDEIASKIEIIPIKLRQNYTNKSRKRYKRDIINRLLKLKYAFTKYSDSNSFNKSETIDRSTASQVMDLAHKLNSFNFSNTAKVNKRTKRQIRKPSETSENTNVETVDKKKGRRMFPSLKDILPSWLVGGSAESSSQNSSISENTQPPLRQNSTESIIAVSTDLERNMNQTFTEEKSGFKTTKSEDSNVKNDSFVSTEFFREESTCSSCNDIELEQIATPKELDIDATKNSLQFGLDGLITTQTVIDTEAKIEDAEIFDEEIEPFNNFGSGESPFEVVITETNEDWLLDYCFKKLLSEDLSEEFSTLFDTAKAVTMQTNLNENNLRQLENLLANLHNPQFLQKLNVSNQKEFANDSNNMSERRTRFVGDVLKFFDFFGSGSSARMVEESSEKIVFDGRKGPGAELFDDLKFAGTECIKFFKSVIRGETRITKPNLVDILNRSGFLFNTVSLPPNPPKPTDTQIFNFTISELIPKPITDLLTIQTESSKPFNLITSTKTSLATTENAREFTSPITLARERKFLNLFGFGNKVDESASSNETKLAETTEKTSFLGNFFNFGAKKISTVKETDIAQNSGNRSFWNSLGFGSGDERQIENKESVQIIGTSNTLDKDFEFGQSTIFPEKQNFTSENMSLAFELKQGNHTSMQAENNQLFNNGTAKFADVSTQKSKFDNNLASNANNIVWVSTLINDDGDIFDSTNKTLLQNEESPVTLDQSSQRNTKTDMVPENLNIKNLLITGNENSITSETSKDETLSKSENNRITALSENASTLVLENVNNTKTNDSQRFFFLPSFGSGEIIFEPQGENDPKPPVDEQGFFNDLAGSGSGDISALKLNKTEKNQIAVNFSGQRTSTDPSNLRGFKTTTFRDVPQRGRLSRSRGARIHEEIEPECNNFECFGEVETEAAVKLEPECNNFECMGEIETEVSIKLELNCDDFDCITENKTEGILQSVVDRSSNSATESLSATHTNKTILEFRAIVNETEECENCTIKINLSDATSSLNTCKNDCGKNKNTTDIIFDSNCINMCEENSFKQNCNNDCRTDEENMNFDCENDCKINATQNMLSNCQDCNVENSENAITEKISNFDCENQCIVNNSKQSFKNFDCNECNIENSTELGNHNFECKIDCGVNISNESKINCEDCEINITESSSIQFNNCNEECGQIEKRIECANDCEPSDGKNDSINHKNCSCKANTISDIHSGLDCINICGTRTSMRFENLTMRNCEDYCGSFINTSTNMPVLKECGDKCEYNAMEHNVITPSGCNISCKVDVLPTANIDCIDCEIDNSTGIMVNAATRNCVDICELNNTTAVNAATDNCNDECMQRISNNSTLVECDLSCKLNNESDVSNCMNSCQKNATETLVTTCVSPCELSTETLLDASICDNGCESDSNEMEILNTECINKCKMDRFVEVAEFTNISNATESSCDNCELNLVQNNSHAIECVNCLNNSTTLSIDINTISCEGECELNAEENQTVVEMCEDECMTLTPQVNRAHLTELNLASTEQDFTAEALVTANCEGCEINITAIDPKIGTDCISECDVNVMQTLLRSNKLHCKSDCEVATAESTDNITKCNDGCEGEIMNELVPNATESLCKNDCELHSIHNLRMLDCVDCANSSTEHSIDSVHLTELDLETSSVQEQSFTTETLHMAICEECESNATTKHANIMDCSNDCEINVTHSLSRLNESNCESDCEVNETEFSNAINLKAHDITKCNDGCDDKIANDFVHNITENLCGNDCERNLIGRNSRMLDSSTELSDTMCKEDCELNMGENQTIQMCQGECTATISSQINIETNLTNSKLRTSIHKQGKTDEVLFVANCEECETNATIEDPVIVDCTRECEINVTQSLSKLNESNCEKDCAVAETRFVSNITSEIFDKINCDECEGNVTLIQISRNVENSDCENDCDHNTTQTIEGESINCKDNCGSEFTDQKFDNEYTTHEVQYDEFVTENIVAQDKDTAMQICTHDYQCDFFLNERCIFNGNFMVCGCGRSFIRHPSTGKCETKIVLETSLRFPEEEYVDDLKNPKSEIYIQKMLDANAMMWIILNDSPELRASTAGFSVMGFYPGSLIVKWNMVMAAHINETMQEISEYVDQALRETLTHEEVLKQAALKTENVSLLKISLAIDPCQISELNYCSQFADCIRDDSRPGGFLCRCKDGNIDNSKDRSTHPGEICQVICPLKYCGEHGTCKVNDAGERECLCSGWYLGERCHISGIVLIIIISVANIILIATILLLVCCLKKKRRAPRGSHRRTFVRSCEYGLTEHGLYPYMGNIVATSDIMSIPPSFQKFTPAIMPPEIKVIRPSVKKQIPAISPTISNMSFFTDSSFDTIDMGTVIQGTNESPRQESDKSPGQESTKSNLNETSSV